MPRTCKTKLRRYLRLARYQVYCTTPDQEHDDPKAGKHHRIFRGLWNRCKNAEQPVGFIVGSRGEVQQMAASPGSVVSRRNCPQAIDHDRIIVGVEYLAEKRMSRRIVNIDVAVSEIAH